eukprot:CAMPEP_0203667976 /NCGR_PEP_ID=MMETSP0090-20130426/4696_1 /ASSEMBLY_ACC=CAM_ASM_001088 /TAXON_ID=426623 /ORGANISM="Chaetoceros affinis, Strain CCMP159" /LENGTH=388 /DNA_ID=CAMNT_0050532283 /DNA_START=539 /DNA_END=1705 /DNA_ORIENTATION=+
MILQTIKDTFPQIVSLYSNADPSLPPSSSPTTTSKSLTLAKIKTIHPLVLASAATAITTTALLLLKKATSASSKNSSNMSNLVSKIYDFMILHMTEKWYESVLNQLDDNCVVLDVGIGTAGALLRCKEIIKKKNIKVIGIDYNPYYISAAKSSIEQNEMTELITVHCIDLYDGDKLKEVIQNETTEQGVGLVDVVYFSGSFSLLPNPKGALLSVIPFLRTEAAKKGAKKSSSTGLIYITQTYQKRVLPLLSNVKPLLKYMTTIDFGQMVKVEEIHELLNDEELVENKLLLKEHGVIEGSLDNYWQAAYLSILEVEVEQDENEEVEQTSPAEESKQSEKDADDKEKKEGRDENEEEEQTSPAEELEQSEEDADDKEKKKGGNFWDGWFK